MVATGIAAVACWTAAPTLAWLGSAGSVLLTFGAVSHLILPADAYTAVMLLIGVLMFSLEIWAYPGLLGMHATGGAVCLAAGGALNNGGEVGANPAIVVPTAAAVGVVAYQAGRRSHRCQRWRPLETPQQLTGCSSVVLSSDGRAGYGVVAGSLWELVPHEGALREGEPVEVVDAYESFLVVKHVADADCS